MKRCFTAAWAAALAAVLLFVLADRIAYQTLPAAENAEEPYFEQSADLVDLNTAPAAELETLPGIGEKRAERIVWYRRLHGKFRTADDLVNVKGISEKMIREIKEYITVS